MKRCGGSERHSRFEPSVLGITSLGAMLSLFGLIPALLAWPLLVGADDIDQQLERNMRVFSHAPSQPRVYGQSLAPEPDRGTQAQMVVFDRMGRARTPQRVALGPLPPPQNSADKPLTEYPRSPQPPKPSWELDYTATSGYRQDRLNWNIAAGQTPPYGYQRPNIISELTWNNLKIAQLAGKAEITSPGGWHFQGNVNYGWITNGNNQDSDYQFNNRQQEWSRSNNDANGGHVLDASIGAGYRFAKRDKEGKVQVGVAPLLGYSYSEQYLTMTNGVQTVSEPSIYWCDNPSFGGPLCPGVPVGYRDPALDSRYSTQWHGPWLGFKFNGQPFDWMEMFTQYEYHWANYYAKANWNRRSDLQHPVSGEFNASGAGMRIMAGLRFKLTPSWALNLDANYSEMNTDPGTSTQYSADGASSPTRLNRVQWESFGFNAGIRYRF